MPVLADSGPTAVGILKSDLRRSTVEARECSLFLVLLRCVASEMKAVCCLYGTHWEGWGSSLCTGQMVSPGRWQTMLYPPRVQHLCSISGQLMPNRSRTPSSHVSQTPGAVFFIPPLALALTLALHWHSPQYHNKPGWKAKATVSYLHFPLLVYS